MEPANRIWALSMIQRQDVKKINIDKCPTSKGHCYFCKEQMIKGSLRGKFTDIIRDKFKLPKGWKGNFMLIDRLVCYKCLPYFVLSIQEHHEHRARTLAKDLKKIKRALKGKRMQAVTQSKEILDELQREDVISKLAVY